MSYDVQISKNREWWDEEIGGGISLDEWKSYLASDDSMRVDGITKAKSPEGTDVHYENEGLAAWVVNPNHAKVENVVWFDYRDGRVVVKNPDAETLRKMHSIAVQFVASVFGDEGEEYDENGLVVGFSAVHSKEPKKPWWKLW